VPALGQSVADFYLKCGQILSVKSAIFRRDVYAGDGRGGGVLFLENVLIFSIDLMRSPNAGAVRL